MKAIEQLLEQCGLGELLAEDRELRLQRIAQEVAGTAREVARRLPPGSFDLVDEMRADPEALRPLIELFPLAVSNEMRAMVYFVLRGMDLKEIDFSYRLMDSVSLRVVLLNDASGQELVFSSEVVWDAVILRRIFIMTQGDKPIYSLA